MDAPGAARSFSDLERLLNQVRAGSGTSREELEAACRQCLRAIAGEELQTLPGTDTDIESIVECAMSRVVDLLATPAATSAVELFGRLRQVLFDQLNAPQRDRLPAGDQA